MDVVTNGCNGTHHDGERTENQTNVILSTLPHSKNNVNDSSANSNAGSISNKSIKSVKTKRSKKSEALLDDNRYALRIEDMVEEHLKFGRSAFELELYLVLENCASFRFLSEITACAFDIGR